MKTKDVLRKVEELARPAAETLGLNIWDVAFEKEGGSYYLTVYVDRDEGVSIEDCEALSREIDPLLDEKDMIDVPYTFCVSSAGLERRLSRPEHFEKCRGRKVELKFYRAQNGAKEAVGVLEDADDKNITISENGEKKVFEKENIATTRLYFEF